MDDKKSIHKDMSEFLRFHHEQDSIEQKIKYSGLRVIFYRLRKYLLPALPRCYSNDAQRKYSRLDQA